MAVNLLVWNMEWMNDLFESNVQAPTWRADAHQPQHSQDTTVRQRRDQLSGVLNDLSPDIVVAVEAPNRTGELQLFFDDDVAGNWNVWVQPSPGMSQCVGLAVRTDTGRFSNPPFTAYDTVNNQAFDPFLVDTDSDQVEESHHFERRPLYVEIHPASGADFRIVGLHLKSKAIFDSLEWSRWWQRAEGDRRKLLAQANQLRVSFLDPYLTTPATQDIPLVVCGDINDGPGMDAAEKRVFGSAVERLMGNVWRPDLTLGNAIFDTLSAGKQASLDFEDISTTSFRDPIFNYVWHHVWIDHVLYSMRGSANWVSNAQIRHTMPNGQRIWQAYRHASDHYPITVTVTT
jgi:endonuclease/exonuclease/phosphatase family metal-dependent hydrolase